jgi:3-phenylpropionate/trans-cinnamate dioxygenase ferredoxin subunit
MASDHLSVATSSACAAEGAQGIDADSLADGAMVAAKAAGHNYLVARVGSEFYVTDEHCPHMGGNLAKGKLDGTVVTCPLHHSQFDLTDGHVVRWTDFTGPLEQINETIRHHRPLPVYEVRVADGEVSVGPLRPGAEGGPEAG